MNAGPLLFSQQVPVYAMQEIKDDTGWDQTLSCRMKQRKKREAQGTIKQETASDKGRNNKFASRQSYCQQTFKSRLPPLPQDFKIVIRLRKGLPLKNFSGLQIKSIANECPDKLNNMKEATVHPRWNLNVIFVSTPNKEAANEFQKLKTLRFGRSTYNAILCGFLQT